MLGTDCRTGANAVETKVEFITRPGGNFFNLMRTFLTRCAPAPEYSTTIRVLNEMISFVSKTLQESRGA
jgi:hypothetical protein